MELTCPQCRHVVTLDDAPAHQPRCHNCGATIPAPPADGPTPAGPTSAAPGNGAVQAVAPVGPPPGSGVAVAALVCALLFFIPLLPQAAAVVLAVYALVQLRSTEGRRAAAWAALILGLFVGAGWLLLVIGGLRAAFTGGAGYGTGYVVGPYAASATLEVHEGRLARIRNGLERIGAAVTAYRRDIGRWPQTLEDMVPTYLSNAVLDDVDPERASTERRLITLVPGVDPLGDPPDTIVAYSARVTIGESGEQLAAPRRWVLLLNGEILSRDAAEVEAAVAHDDS